MREASHWHDTLSVFINQAKLDYDSAQKGEAVIVASTADEILKLSELRNQGAITDEEFATLKSKLIT